MRAERHRMVVGLNSQRRVCAVAFVAWVFASGGTVPAAAAAPCPGNADAIGVSRTLTVSATDYPRLGLMQYRRSLPLNDREVVLTFDDGPLPPYTDKVLEILARDCVKATFFLVGRHVTANPDAARRVLAAGHTVGNHSQNHSLHFDQIAKARAEQEVENGFRTIRAALGPQAVAPFFRVPGLNRTSAVEKFAQSHAVVVWSSDTLADDWKRITANQVLQRALSRLEARGKGILLLHDIQPRTVLMLPQLLAELKRRHFRIVHVVPEQDGVPVPAPAEAVAQAQAKAPDRLGWPRIASAGGVMTVAATADAAHQETVTGHEEKMGDVAADSVADPVPLPPSRRKLKIRHRRSHTVAAVEAPQPTYFRPDTY